MTIGKKVREALKRSFVPARSRYVLSVGDSVRLAREFNEMSQNQLAAKSGIPQATISGIEKNRINLGVERAKTLARALHVHPAVLLFPGWKTSEKTSQAA